MRHSSEEIAYRRGVHHGLRALKAFMERSPNNVFGIEACLDAAVSHAEAMRREKDPHPKYVDEIVHRIMAEIADHDEFYARTENQL